VHKLHSTLPVLPSGTLKHRPPPFAATAHAQLDTCAHWQGCTKKGQIFCGEVVVFVVSAGPVRVDVMVIAYEVDVVVDVVFVIDVTPVPEDNVIIQISACSFTITAKS